jgi:dTDP-4-amino-4,6-dideoxygalactose transaminase
MNDRVYLSAPDVGLLEETYVLAALRSGWVAPLGPEVDAFEQEMSVRVGVPHAVALSSGTAALHLALLGIGAGPGDLIVVPTLTFAATANAVMYTGATPVFVDSEPWTGNVDVDLLAELLDQLRSKGTPARAVLPVDLFGECADYARILPLCAEHGVPVIADAAESLGATHAGRPAGSFGSAAVLSFNGNKIMTTSGGGMLLTADEPLARRARYLASQARQPVDHYEHTDVGYNYRLSNLLAALGRAQLLRLDEMISRRRRLRESYTKIFAGMDGVRLLAAGHDGGNCWLTTIVVEREQAGWCAGDLAAYLAQRNIETRPVWKPMHLQPVYAGTRRMINGSAERIFATGVILPSGSSLDEAQTSRVLTAVHDFLDGGRPFGASPGR